MNKVHEALLKKQKEGKIKILILSPDVIKFRVLANQMLVRYTKPEEYEEFCESCDSPPKYTFESTCSGSNLDLELFYPGVSICENCLVQDLENWEEWWEEV